MFRRVVYAFDRLAFNKKKCIKTTKFILRYRNTNTNLSNINSKANNLNLTAIKLRRNKSHLSAASNSKATFLAAVNLNLTPRSANHCSLLD